MSYSNTNFPMPIVIDHLPVAGNLSVFDQNFNAVSSYLANVANLTSSSSAYVQANAAYAQANIAYNQANAAYAQANLSVIPYQLKSGCTYVTLTTDGTLHFNTGGNISSQSISIQPIMNSSPWVVTFGDLAGSNSNYGASVVIDSDNNSYLFGADDDSANTNYVVKFDSSGTEIWQKQIGDVNADYKYSDALHIDASDNIYLSLNVRRGPQNNSYIVKMDTDAGIIWQTNLTGLYLNSEYGIATDSTGNVFTVGQIDNDFDAAFILLCKFDSSGVLLQHNFLYNTNYEAGYNLAIDSADNILVTGFIHDNTFGDTMYVGKYANADLSRIWERKVSGQYIDQSSSYGYSITTDESNSVYVFGNANLNSQGAPAIVIKFGSDGSVNWTNRFGDFGCKYQAQGFGIVYDNGSLYVCGGVNSTDYGYYILLGKINASTGGLTWLNEFRDPTGINYVFPAYNTPDKPIAVRNNYISISAYNYGMEVNQYRATLLRVPTDGTGIGTAGPFAYGKARIPYISTTLTINPITLSSTPGTLTQQPGDLSVSILDASYNVNSYSMITEWKFTNTSGLVFPDSTVQYSAAPVFDQPLNTQSTPEFVALAITDAIIFSGNSQGYISAQDGGLTANSLSLGSLFGNVVISANAINNTKGWIFGTDGILTMPAGNETTSGWIRWNHAQNDFNNYAGAGYVDNYNIYTGMGLFSPNNSIVMGTPADQYNPFIPETTLVFKNDSLYLPANGYIKSHTADYTGYPTLSHYNANVNIQTGSKVVDQFAGGSIDFSGTNDQFISLPYTSDLSGWTTQNFTIEWWQYSTSHTNPYQRPFQIGTYSSGNGFGIGYEDFRFNLRWSGQYFSFGALNSAIPLNTWQHVAIVRYNNVVTVYADGVALGSTSVSDLAYASVLPFNIGGSSVDGLHDYEGGNGLFTGRLYDFRFVIGNALYTNNFTPPSMALDLVANTQLLFLAQTAPSVLTYYSYPNVAHTDANNNNGVSWSSSTPLSSIVTTDYTWTFDTNGTLTSPGDLLPSSNNTGNIGTPDLQWKSLYVSNGSVYIDGVRLSSNSGSLVVGGNITLSNNSSLNDYLGRPIISAASGNIIDGNLVGGGASEVFGPEDLSFDGGSIESHYDVYAPEIDGGVSSTPQTILNVDGSSSIVQVKRNTSNNWIQTNPILSQGEIGFETDTGLIKIGTGSTPWNSLTHNITDRISNTTNALVMSANGALTLPTAGIINSSNGLKLNTNLGNITLGSFLGGPGLSSHFHIAFSESNSFPPSGDLFLGDDLNYVKLPGGNGDLYETYGVDVGTNDRSTGSLHVWRFGTDGTLTLPANTKLNSGGVGNTNSAEFGTAVSSNGTAITSSQIYMGAGTAETRVIVDQNGASLIYSGVEHSYPGAFAGSVSVDPNVTSDYAIAIGPNNSILLGAAQGGITTTEYTTGVGVFNSDNNITGLLSNGNNVIIAAGSLGWSFDRDGTLTSPGDLIPSSNNTANIGSPTSQWKSLHVSNGSIYIDGVKLSSNSGSLVVGGNITLSNNSSLNDSLGRPIVSASSGNIIDGNLVGGGAAEVFGPEDLNFDGGSIETYHNAYDAAVDGGVSSTPQTILNVDGVGTTIQVKRNSSNNWIQTNSILSQGEIGFETDTGSIKIGTGLTAWNSLSYVSVNNVISNTQTIKLSPDDVAHPELAWSIKSGNSTPYPGGTVYEGSILMSPPSDLASIGAIGFMGTVGESGWPNDVQDTFGAAGSIGWMGNDPTFYPNIRDALWINSAKNVAIFANNNSTATLSVRQWVFGANGQFVFPDGSITSGSTLIANGTYNIQSLSDTIIQTSAGSGVQTWVFGADGSLTLPSNNKFAVVNVPTTSLGKTGDYAGMVAANSVNFFQCVANYVSSNFTPPSTALPIITDTVLLISEIDSANLLTDSTANYTITNNTSVTWAANSPFTDGSGSAYFDGANNYLQLEQNLTLSGDFTIEAFVYRTVAVDDADTIFSIQGSAGDWDAGGGGLVISAGRIDIAPISPPIFYSSPIQTNVWTHIAVSRKGSTIFVYLNGDLVATANEPSILGTGGGYPLIGAFDFYNGTGNPPRSPWNGYITNLRINGVTALYYQPHIWKRVAWSVDTW